MSQIELPKKDKLDCFRQSFKTGKNEDPLNVKTAIILGYLDVCRKPLKGLKQSLEDGCNESPKIVRDRFIKDHFIPAIDCLMNDMVDFDQWHRNMCTCIRCFYAKKGYESFTVGKAQKWINMSLKYIYFYSNERENFSKYLNKLHVPIDRVMANHIAVLIHELPGYERYTFKALGDSFDAEKANYCWSKIDDYDQYLDCQKRIRNKLVEGCHDAISGYHGRLLISRLLRTEVPDTIKFL